MLRIDAPSNASMLTSRLSCQTLGQTPDRNNLTANGELQQTLDRAITFIGTGVHSGKPASLRITPAPANTGYIFIRTDVACDKSYILARWDTVTDTAMCTTITNGYGIHVSTIEHVTAALSGCHIHNAFIELDGPEVPIMDGSSVDFVRQIHQTSIVKQAEKKRQIKILKTVKVEFGTSFATLEPSDECKFDMQFDGNGRFGNRSWSLTYYPEHDSFEKLISSARTFGFYEDAQHLWSQGLAQGASLDNTVVIKDGQVLNEGGLRYPDEHIRHKMLDAIGDLALAGGQILGHFKSRNSGHSLNNRLLRALFANNSAWCWADY